MSELFKHPPDNLRLQNARRYESDVNWRTRFELIECDWMTFVESCGLEETSNNITFNIGMTLREDGQGGCEMSSIDHERRVSSIPLPSSQHFAAFTKFGETELMRIPCTIRHELYHPIACALVNYYFEDIYIHSYDILLEIFVQRLDAVANKDENSTIVSPNRENSYMRRVSLCEDYIFCTIFWLAVEECERLSLARMKYSCADMERILLSDESLSNPHLSIKISFTIKKDFKVIMDKLLFVEFKTFLETKSLTDSTYEVWLNYQLDSCLKQLHTVGLENKHWAEAVKRICMFKNFIDFSKYILQKHKKV